MNASTQLRKDQVQQVRREFQAAGISVSEWCRQNHFSRELVNQVLSGKNKGLRGQGHKIMVALGLKPGAMVVSVKDFKPACARAASAAQFGGRSA